MKLQLDCREVSRLLSDRLDGELGRAQGARLALHLIMCRHCRSAQEQLAFIQRATQQWRAQQDVTALPDTDRPSP